MRKKILLILACIPVHGDEVMNQVVVTATRSKIPLSDSTFTSEYLNYNFIKDQTRRTLPEALSFTPGVLSQKTTYGHGSPFIRGFTGRENLLLVDGVRLNKSTWRSGPVQYWNTVDSFALERMELVKNQGSVAYGSDAVGGTLNAFTRSSHFEKEALGKFFSHGSAHYEYRSNGDGSNIGRLDGDIGQGGIWGLHGGISLKDFGDIRDSSMGKMKNTGYGETAWDIRFDAKLNQSTKLTLAHQDVSQDDIWRWHRARFNTGWKHGDNITQPGTWTSNIYNQDRSLSYLRVESENPQADTWLSNWSATLSYQNAKEAELQDRTPAATKPPLPSAKINRRLQSSDVDTYGIDLKFESPMGSGKWIYGMDYYRDEVSAEAFKDKGLGYVFDPTLRPVADNSSYDLFGYHVQYHWQATEKLRVESGVRFTHAEANLGKRYDGNAKKDISATRKWDEPVLSLRAVQELPENWSIYGGVAQAFRAPNLADLSGATTSGSGKEILGSVDLEPERFLTYEIGTRYSTDHTWFNASFFYNDISNIITDVSVTKGSATTLASNGRDGYIYGIELEGAWEFHPQWTLSGFIAWQEGETRTQEFVGGKDVTEPFSRVLPLTASVALKWTASSEKYWIEGRVIASEKADRLSSSDVVDNQRFPSNGTPGYIVPMIHAGWKATDYLDLTLGLENITDKDYRIHGSGNNESGFNAIVGAKLSF
jgi:hemoglobin/transferrin/lactoferrin receptor protein